MVYNVCAPVAYSFSRLSSLVSHIFILFSTQYPLPSSQSECRPSVYPSLPLRLSSYFIIPFPNIQPLPVSSHTLPNYLGTTFNELFAVRQLSDTLATQET